MTTPTGLPDSIRYIVTSSKSVDQAQMDLEAAVTERKFSVLQTLDMKRTLNEKGFELAPAVRVLAICNAGQAIKVLQADIAMNLALPCRISVWQEAGQTRIGMLRPKALLQMLSETPALCAIAEEVEEQMIAMVDAAR